MQPPAALPGNPAASPEGPRQDIPWHTLTWQEAMARLGSSRSGLSSIEAARRLAESGPNELAGPERDTAWALLLGQFKNILTLLLFAAAILSLFLGHSAEALAIAVIVLFSVVLGFVQEYRAEKAMAALRKLAAPVARTLRDGDEKQILAREVVLGDVLLLRAGDRAPADARLMDAFSLCLDEAALTGESAPVDKDAGPLDLPDLVLTDRRNMAYAGTLVTRGRGQGLVVATGMGTEFGGIAGMLQTIQHGKTPLQTDLDRLARMLVWAGVAVVMMMAGLALLRGHPVLEMLIFGIALAVAIVPEALPAVLTISLALGARRMIHRHVLMRRLSTAETIGCVSVICADKTGTLTKDEMTVRRIYLEGEMLEVSGSGYEPVGTFLRQGAPVEPTPALREFLRSALLSSDARLVPGEEGRGWRVQGDPTDGALVAAAAKAGLVREDLEAGFPRVGEIPFASESRRMTTLHEGPDRTEAFSKGAPEVIVEGCARWVTPGGEAALDAPARGKILGAAREMAEEGLRVLALARKAGASLQDAEHHMTFLGLAGMMDPPRPEAFSAVQACRKAGIKVVMISGDHPLTARVIARELRVLDGGRVVTGNELEAMSEEELEGQVETIDVYARMLPAQKLRVVTALQKRGYVVAMTGDGVNDAPALHKADVGVAMGITGTDVTREAADMTITDDNFASIVAAVEEGRCIFDNTRKYLMYLFSSNIGEVGLMAGAGLLGLPLPLTAVQLLYVNLATDGLPALALAADPPDRELMRRTPRDPRAGIFTRPVVALMLVGGFWSAVMNLGLLAWALGMGRSLEEARTLTFATLVLTEFFKAYCFRSHLRTALRNPLRNRWLNLAILWELLLLSAVIYAPVFHQAFGGTRLRPQDWAVAFLIAATIVPVLEMAKWVGTGGRSLTQVARGGIR